MVNVSRRVRRRFNGLKMLAIAASIFVPLTAVATTATPAQARTEPIHITGSAPSNVRTAPNTGGRIIGSIPVGRSPDYHCWAVGQNIRGVNVWFYVTYMGETGYYASYWDSSTYPTDNAITRKYGIPRCGSHTVSAAQVRRHIGHIVQWHNGAGRRNTAWYVLPNGHRNWIPTTNVYWCLRHRGVPDDGAQPAVILNTLPDDTGHWATCPTINVLNIGDSYGSGNGGGNYYYASPDDPRPTSGRGCYRSWNNSSYKAARALMSHGLYINRACSGATAKQIARQAVNLYHTPIAGKINLITYDGGGDDGGIFRSIVISCFLLGRANCPILLDKANGMIPSVVQRDKANIVALLNHFPHAHLVLSGYPLLVAPIPPPAAAGTYSSTWAWGRFALINIIKRFTAQQATMIRALNKNPRYAGRVAFNNVFALFGYDHGVGAGSESWLVEPLRLTDRANTNFHPTPTGWQKMADGIVAQVRRHHWFR